MQRFERELVSSDEAQPNSVESQATYVLSQKFNDWFQLGSKEFFENISIVRRKKWERIKRGIQILVVLNAEDKEFQGATKPVTARKKDSQAFEKQRWIYSVSVANIRLYLLWSQLLTVETLPIVFPFLYNRKVYSHCLYSFCGEHLRKLKLSLVFLGASSLLLRFVSIHFEFPGNFILLSSRFQHCDVVEWVETITYPINSDYKNWEGPRYF